ncbi:HMG box family protein [Trichomonas vaginalis G3]|uniref:HMG box family protein n=1 Tax=Trichomonas vaginalis (strain ATCC PRA-98 / G3) TaxID=412133 RepID=A2ES52_TRIV3|nr:high mobility group box domain domain-containing protein [Trichomonas vaginalis G3]EAY04489.1 HMG box family protein [Trichomonas vaginalis G3]KAI5503286.1 high mobility group box domain domain-containing protein [Trichomonas vaginalis G3]|eukprot:XP_001316712.1 HMG box family protein [Trichomonas vaginalis G3]
MKSPYIIFSIEKRKEIKEKNPKASFGKIAKIIGKMWKELSEEEKNVWIEKAKAQTEEAN